MRRNSFLSINEAIHEPQEPSISPANAGAVSITTGRPPMWTKSAQQELTRLYLYTNLPLAKIVEIIHRSSAEGVPGIDSAHKKLNWLLDKEPRWLRAKSLQDMGKRLHQLAESYKPLPQPRQVELQGFSTSNPGPDGFPSPRIKAEQVASPISTFPYDNNRKRTIPTKAEAEAADIGSKILADLGSQVSYDCMAAMSHPDLIKDNLELMPFLRASTTLSATSNSTTGSFQRILIGRSAAYIKAVKRLVKKFIPRRAGTLRATATTGTPCDILQWLDDGDAAPEIHDKPFPLSGDFLLLDQYLQHRCLSHTADHTRRRCMCEPTREIWNSPFTSSLGLTGIGEQLLNGNFDNNHVSIRDAFSNTALHFLAARGSIDQLWTAVTLREARFIWERTNSAGQNFLHVVRRSAIRRTDKFCELLRYLRENGFDLKARDVYGQTPFHVLQQNGITADVQMKIADACGGYFPHVRDAFGRSAVNPMEPPPNPALKNILGYWSTDNPEYWNTNIVESQSQGNFPIGSPADTGSSSCGEASQPAAWVPPAAPETPDVEQARCFLNTVNWAMHFPEVEDEEGRNALHCLSLANLSLWQRTDGDTAAAGPSRKRKLSDVSDSSAPRMQVRHSLFKKLLLYGVDPNHYDHRGNTPLMTCVASLPEDGDYLIGPAIIKTLIEGGANVHGRNRRGETALHVAARCGKKLAVRALVKNGANVHARDSSGRSVLQVLDAKMTGWQNDVASYYSHFEACRAWLSGTKGKALQHPTVVDEWRRGK